MSHNDIEQLQSSLSRAFKEVLQDKSVEELRKLDWLSLNADFWIAQDKKKAAA